MKTTAFYTCSRCAYRSEHKHKCINCHIPLEKMCMVCNNAETNCYFVNCSRIRKTTNKKMKINGIAKKTAKQRKK